MEMAMCLLNDAYEAIFYKPTSVPLPPMDKTLQRVAALLQFIREQGSFWMALVYEIHLCDMNPQEVANLMPPFMLARLATGVISELPVLESTKEICAKLSIGKYGVHRRTDRVHSEGGELVQGAKHEKLKQVLQIISAIDHLVTVDVRYELKLLNQTRPVSSSAPSSSPVWIVVDTCAKVSATLYQKVLPLAFAALWLWKAHERGKKRHEKDAFLIQMLWQALLRLRSIMGAYPSNIRTWTIGRYSSMFSSPEAMVVSTDRPILEFTVDELWISLRQLSWTTSLIVPGALLYEYLDILWLRASALGSSVGDDAMYNRPLLCKSKDDGFGGQIWFAAEHFFEETERIFFHLFDRLWLHALMTHKSIITTPITTAPEAAMANRWFAVVENLLKGGTGEFLRLEYERRLWWHHTQLDDIEHYQQESRTLDRDPRRAVMRLAQLRFDKITEVAGSTLQVLWQPACEAGLEAMREWAVPGRMQLGVQWSALWEISARQDQRQRVEDSLPYREEVTKDGTRHFIHKSTGQRLRGTDSEIAKLLLSRIRTVASKTEFDAIQEAALEIVLQKTRTEYTTKAGADAPEVAHWPFVTNILTSDVYSLLALSSIHTPLKHLTSLTPAILWLFNEYVVHDGERCVGHSPFLVHALEMYAHYVEAQISKQLHALACVADQISHTNPSALRDIITQARRVIIHIPPILRHCFNLIRDEATGLPSDDSLGEAEESSLKLYHLYEPIAPALCNWTRDFLEERPIWDVLTEYQLATHPQATHQANLMDEELEAEEDNALDDVDIVIPGAPRPSGGDPSPSSDSTNKASKSKRIHVIHL